MGEPTTMQRLSDGKAIAVSPRGKLLDLRLLDRGRWGAASLTPSQVRALCDEMSSWLRDQDYAGGDQYERDLLVFGNPQPMPIQLFQPMNCVSIDLLGPEEDGFTEVRIVTTAAQTMMVECGNFVAVVVNGARRLARVWSMQEGELGSIPPGHPGAVVTLRAGLPLIERRAIETGMEA